MATRTSTADQQISKSLFILHLPPIPKPFETSLPPLLRAQKASK